jgi:hypothetical protein
MLLSSLVLRHLTFVKHTVFSNISLNLEIDIRENSLNTAWNLSRKSNAILSKWLEIAYALMY